MFLTIPGILSKTDVKRVLEKAGALDWRDGRETAGRTARAVKSNLQADLKSEAGQGLHDFLMSAISADATMKAMARPKRYSRLLLSRTEGGGHYGFHVDNALMSTDGRQMRTDLSFTLFLSAPETYEGGELHLLTAAGDFMAKPEAGTMILYPSGAIHQVKPVTKGSRIACVGWIESRIQRADQREILFDLESTRAALPKGTREQKLILDKTISNLIRMWAS
ncbi:Fe2+-dependent dioxygenase [Henriciella pelagia]|uniref:PKHD-type hydroxylase YbiX n=1 Tax=Henriciella pelagia TaxID=1977912 RepID=A0ABQ1JNZ5_9PROT|nr:Fe2+-dependent dioxygenase [Henriciella pelagia]GGB71911.1 PKHD-type hydroxylase YbiX [Henriciella pelagia]